MGCPSGVFAAEDRPPLRALVSALTMAWLVRDPVKPISYLTRRVVGFLAEATEGSTRNFYNTLHRP